MHVCVYVVMHITNISFYIPPSLVLSLPLSPSLPPFSLSSAPLSPCFVKEEKRQDKRSIDDPRPQRSGEIFAELNWISQQLHYHRLYGRIRENEIKKDRLWEGGGLVERRGGRGVEEEKKEVSRHQSRSRVMNESQSVSFSRRNRVSFIPGNPKGRVSSSGH